MSGEEEIIIIHGGQQVAKFSQANAVQGLRELADLIESDQQAAAAAAAGADQQG